MTQQHNILKVRDDIKPFEFEGCSDSLEFLVDIPPSWLQNKKTISRNDLRNRIEPWLTSLFQSEHLSLLIGSGLTHAVHVLATGKAAVWMEDIDFGEFQKFVDKAAEKSANNINKIQYNFEDQLRVANELYRGLNIMDQIDRAEKLMNILENLMKNFAKSILKSENEIANANNSMRDAAFNCLVTFLMSFASRSGTRDRLNIFTTNYDRLIEIGAELAGLHLIDRFIGNMAPIFRSSRLDIDLHYNPPGIRGEPRYLEGVARFAKLHGSVDWIQSDKDIRRIGLPFGTIDISPYLHVLGENKITPYDLMIYPNAAKDSETSAYPYVELFRDLAASICKPNCTLVTYGYSFGDEHINRIIRDMLTIPSTHLIVIAYDDLLGRIMSMYDMLGRPAQISLLIGPILADLTQLTKFYLPKSSIDKTTFRMSELLKQRLGVQQADANENDKQLGD